MSDSTILVITTSEAFQKLPAPGDMDHIQTLHIGARLYRSMPRDELFAWIAGFAALRSIYLADDWIPDDQMTTVAAEFTESFPSVAFKWSHDGLAGGKHGR